MTPTDVLIRLVAALAVGGALGLNRDLHRKPAGVRTIGIVSLGSAMLTMAAGTVPPGQLANMGVSPIISGILTGIGFLGAGVIVRGETANSIHGLTTAAIIWFAAGIGILAGLGEWVELTIATVLVFIIMIFGGRFERWINAAFEPVGLAAASKAKETQEVGTSS